MPVVNPELDFSLSLPTRKSTQMSSGGPFGNIRTAKSMNNALGTISAALVQSIPSAKGEVSITDAETCVSKEDNAIGSNSPLMVTMTCAL